MNRMNRLIFEGRFLVNITGSIIRQDALHPLHRRIDWERMYRTADYHKIANIAYLAVLGNGEIVEKQWQERFFIRYQEALRYNDICVTAEYEILTLLDMAEVSCIILASGGVRNLYQLTETAANHPLRLYLDSENYLRAKGFLVDLGYETEQIYSGFGERMKQISGFSVEIYHKLPFKTKVYQKQAVRLLDHAYLRSSFKFVRMLRPEDRFILRVAEAACHYATDELIIRELMDIHHYYQAFHAQLNEEYIKRTLAGFRIDELGKKLIQLSRMWFGKKEDASFGTAPKDMEVYDVLENRILSRGQIKKETDRQALFLAAQIEAEEQRELHKKRREKIKKQLQGFRSTCLRQLRWIFPEYKYMCALYPALGRIPVLLPFFLFRRIGRLAAGILKGSISQT